jgi:hypothetical protein
MVRESNTSSASYFPSIVPDDAKEYQRFLSEELRKIQTAIDALSAGHLDKVFIEPVKPRDGDIRYADGTSWKPNGSGGAGIWYYNGATWTQLG